LVLVESVPLRPIRIETGRTVKKTPSLIELPEGRTVRLEAAALCRSVCVPPVVTNGGIGRQG
jgi:hypothetical protein